MDRKTFRQCPNGHWYQGAECPFCKMTSSPFNSVLNNNPAIQLETMKICHRGHKYSLQLSYCPYCGDPEVDVYEEVGTSGLGHVLNIIFRNETDVIVDGVQLGKKLLIGLSYCEHRNGHRSNYSIEQLFLKYNSEISFGDAFFTGKDFIERVDYFLDHRNTVFPPFGHNWHWHLESFLLVDEVEDCPPPKASEDTKVCPHGHSYGQQLDCCPYCGETEIVCYKVGQTIIPASLILSFKHPIVVYVDGTPINEGVLLEVYYNGNYERSNYRVFESPINYKSVIRIGDNVFTGKEFINWVDLMINAKMIDNH